MKTSGWTKALRTVLGIVAIGFFAATIGTLLNETPYASKLDLPEADSGQKRPFATPLADNMSISPTGRIRQSRTLRAIVHPSLADDQYLAFPFAHPQLIQFSVEHHLSVDPYHLTHEDGQPMLYLKESSSPDPTF